MRPALPDVNVWLALSIPRHAFHDAAHEWFTDARERSLLFCRSTQQGLLRLLTTAAVVAPYSLAPLSNRQAIARIAGVLADDRIDLVAEPIGVEEQWMRFSDSKNASPKLWMDAYLAAFAFTGGYRLVSIDRAFKQFPGVDVRLIQ
jgi:toxin-antitoxin system PIN domain toxin